MEDEFPTNSHRAKVKATQPEPAKGEKKVTQVTTEVVRRKKPLSARFRDTFMGGDARSVGAYVFMEIILPGVRSLVVESSQEAISRAVYGENRPAGVRRSPARGGGTYNSVSRTVNNAMQRAEEPRPTLSRRARSLHDFDEILFVTMHDANDVIDQLVEMISKYNVATVADLYGMVGITPNFTDEKWGWGDLRHASVSRQRNGQYLLNLPSPEPID